MMFYDLTKRFTVSLIAIAIIALLIYFSSFIYVQWFVFAFVGIMGAVGAYEYAVLSQLKRKYDLVIAVAAMVWLGYFDLQYCVLGLAFLFFFVSQFGNISTGFNEAVKGFFGLVYLGVPLTMVLSLLFVERGWVVYLLLVTKSVDICAYFGGRFIGKHKLAPELSPGKTIEGGVIGFLGAVLLSLLFGLFHFLSLKESLLMGASLGCVAQIGDLAESLLKRSFGVKDSNRLPGFGGILDMLDSLLFTIPVVYLYLSL
ncbi:MAG: phosphatidate cytidylyltransferase [Simkaniaceae bacterium]|nr:phosphatidate cytidylyltransferase [Simkaniaceae bacterium]